MQLTKVSRRFVLPSVLAAVVALSGAPANAATIWTDWTSATAGLGGGSAAGSLGGVGVSYSGELGGFVINGTSNIWAPASTFIGGTSTTSPSDEGDDLRLTGSFTGTSTITFDTAVTDPLIAIWSLGQPGLAASFTFDATPTLQAGGPNSQFGGSSIGVVGNVVSGTEGNGVVEFSGTFTSISFTSTFENYYAFTVGMNGTPQEVPEPASLLLTGMGMAALLLKLRKRHV